jgi:thymidylate synthase
MNNKKINNTLSSYEAQYRRLLERALTDDAVYRNDRTGIGCNSIFSQNITINISERFPLITGRKMFEKTFKTEFEWFINGETNIKRFKDAGVKIWDAWADEDGELGPVYGYQLRNYNGCNIDQLLGVITSIKNNPDSRRHVVTLWNPLQISSMALPPCYLYFQFFVNNYGELDMFALQRSGDLFLGIPYDIALFSMILLYVAEKTGYKAGRLSLQIVDAHVYSNQEDAIEEYLSQPTYELPKYSFKDGKLEIFDYKHGPVITAAVAV